MNRGTPKMLIMVSNDTAVIAERTKVELLEDLCYLDSNLSRVGNCDK